MDAARSHEPMPTLLKCSFLDGRQAAGPASGHDAGALDRYLQPELKESIT
jgi:hypothetical protein